MTGLAILANSRLLLLPLVLAPYLAWRVRPAGARDRRGRARRRGRGLVTAPWVVRNKVAIGCATITTDTRALWKANNPATYDDPGARWLDRRRARPARTCPRGRRRPPRSRSAAAKAVDECAQMRVLPRRGLRLLARPPRREGATRRAGRRDALVAVPQRDGRRRGTAGGLRPGAADGRARVHAPALRASRSGARSSHRGASSCSSRCCSASTR